MALGWGYGEQVWVSGGGPLSEGELSVVNPGG